MEQILDVTLWIVLTLHLLMGVIVVWRVWRGENSVARLMGLDLASTLTLAVLILVAMLQQNSIYIDVAIALAALSYITTVAIARFISDHKVF